MPSKLALDPRIDPRIKAVFASFDLPEQPDVANRAALLAEEASPAGRESAAAFKAFLDTMDDEAVAPSKGLVTRTETFTSSPDGNSVHIQFIRPEGDEVLPCLYYIHGGGMAILSCFDGNYKAWGRIMAARGVAVAMVDFRNSIRPSSTSEVAAFPAGLNDCVAGLTWVHANAPRLGIDTARIVVAGESGGGNLAIAVALRLKATGSLNLMKGLYALCPFIAGQWPQADCPSSIENEGILINVQSNRWTVGYGIEAFERRDPLAWPRFATAADLEGLPPVIISVNECDPLRDEGINFYRRLIEANVAARCRQVMGTVHATEIFPVCCPDICRDTAADMANFAQN